MKRTPKPKGEKTTQVQAPKAWNLEPNSPIGPFTPEFIVRKLTCSIKADIARWLRALLLHVQQLRTGPQRGSGTALLQGTGRNLLKPCTHCRMLAALAKALQTTVRGSCMIWACHATYGLCRTLSTMCFAGVKLLCTRQDNLHSGKLSLCQTICICRMHHLQLYIQSHATVC